ncbi:MAG TPA: hypothetical protein VGR02_09380 [Thermoanaerobaculia bacterium]|nr:hypothetical protein [Thermoanaerobaculia bacterium]
MKRALVALLLLAACSTTAPPPAADLLLPPPQWWRDPRLNEALKLTDEQLASLDRLDFSELERLRAAASSATRDFRAALAGNADLAASTQRLRAARDAALGEELRLLAAERALLTHTQWEALEDQLRAREDGRRGGDYPRRGSYPRGGGRRPGGGGRWP